MKPMDFFVWQDGRGVNSQAIDDDPNAARRKKTRFHGTLWVGIGITLAWLLRRSVQQVLRTVDVGVYAGIVDLDQMDRQGL